MPPPADALLTWMAYDDTLCVGCCDCGAVLAGAADGAGLKKYGGRQRKAREKAKKGKA